jgi:hypothetical protein
MHTDVSSNRLKMLEIMCECCHWHSEGGKECRGQPKIVYVFLDFVKNNIILAVFRQILCF